MFSIGDKINLINELFLMEKNLENQFKFNNIYFVTSISDDCCELSDNEGNKWNLSIDTISKHFSKL